MNFMLGEYDILPLGLLRHDKTEGATSLDADDVPKFVHCCPAPEQKVMPLDKVSPPSRKQNNGDTESAAIKYFGRSCRSRSGWMWETKLYSGGVCKPW